MVNINETISEIEKLNPELARQLKKYVKDHSYGLVFEHNLPESVRLYTKRPAVGDTVNVMPERGKNSQGFQFMRQGYFCLDNKDATPDHLVFNRSVALKDSFKK